MYAVGSKVRNDVEDKCVCYAYFHLRIHLIFVIACDVCNNDVMIDMMMCYIYNN